MRHYDRNREITIVMPVWRDELADTIPARAALVDKMKRYAEALHKQWLDNHWSHSLPHHRSLCRVLRIEEAALEEAKKAAHP